MPILTVPTSAGMLSTPQIALPFVGETVADSGFAAILKGEDAVLEEDPPLLVEVEVEDIPEVEGRVETIDTKVMPPPVSKVFLPLSTGGQDKKSDVSEAKIDSPVQRDAPVTLPPSSGAPTPQMTPENTLPVPEKPVAVAPMTIPEAVVVDRPTDGPAQLPVVEARAVADPSRIAQSPPLLPSQTPSLRQIVEIAHATQQGSVEIALSPEELGKVRMSLSTADSAISVSILAERPETAELLRANIDALGKEFRALGYSDVSFEFNNHPKQQGQQNGEPAKPQAGLDQPENEHVKTSVTLSDGLDIRL